MKTFGQKNTGRRGLSNMRDRETDTHQVTDNIGWGAINKKMTAIFSDSNRYNSNGGQPRRTRTGMSQHLEHTPLDSDLALVTGTPLVVTLVKWTCRSSCDVNVLKAPKDA